MEEKDTHQHLAAGCFVLNKNKDKVLLIYHKKLQKWLIPGGHVEHYETPHIAAIRETVEETGVTPCIIYSDSTIELLDGSDEEVLPLPTTILRELIPANKKDTEHFHIDFIYLAEAEESMLKPALSEVEDVKWVNLEEVSEIDTFESIKKLSLKFLSKS